MANANDEWVIWTDAVHDERPDVAAAVERFRAPSRFEAGRAASRFLRENALRSSAVTWLLLRDGDVIGYYAVVMSTIELRSQHRKVLNLEHPHQGAVLIAWMAKAEGQPRETADLLYFHALGTARRTARDVGAAVLALDPFDKGVERYWRNERGFRTARNKPEPGKPRRLWRPLFD